MTNSSDEQRPFSIDPDSTGEGSVEPIPSPGLAPKRREAPDAPRHWSPLLKPSMPEIGIWGTRSSGKTTFLAMLYLSTERERAGFDFTMPPLDQEGNTVTVDMLDATTGFIAEAKKAMVDQGRFLKATAHPVEYVFQVRRTTGVENGTNLSLLRLRDRPGEYYNPESNDYELQVVKETARTLAESDGILCLLDIERMIGIGDENPEDYFQAFLYLFSEVRSIAQDETGHIPHPVALCLNKADICWDYYRLNNFEPQEVFDDLVDPFTKKEILRNVHKDRFKVFLCSAVGTIEDEHGRPRPNVHQESGEDSKPAFRITKPGEYITPYAIYEPMKWLFEQLPAIR